MRQISVYVSVDSLISTHGALRFSLVIFISLEHGFMCLGAPFEVAMCKLRVL